MAKLTSRVFACWDELYKLVGGLSWPRHSRTGEAPRVILGDDVVMTGEVVYVLGSVPTKPRQDWATFGAPSKNETFVLRVLIASRVPGTTREEAFARIGELTATLEVELRDETTGRPAGGFATSVPGVLSWRVVGVEPAIWPESEGYVASCEVDVEFKAWI